MVREEWVGVLLRRGFRGAARLIALLFTLLFLLLFVLLFARWSQWSATLDALLTWRRGVSIRGRWTRCIGRVAHTVQWILYGTVDFIDGDVSSVLDEIGSHFIEDHVDVFPCQVQHWFFS